MGLDRAALVQVYETHREKLLLRARCRLKVDAEDVVQDAFRLALARPDGFTDAEAARLWLVRKVKDLCAEHWRKKYRRDRLSEANPYAISGVSAGYVSQALEDERHAQAVSVVVEDPTGRKRGDDPITGLRPRYYRRPYRPKRPFWRECELGPNSWIYVSPTPADYGKACCNIALMRKLRYQLLKNGS